MSDTLHRLGRSVAADLPPLTQSKQVKMACPHLYAEVEVRKIPMAPSPYALRGIEIHEAIEQYLHHLVATKQPSDYEYFDKMLGESTVGSDAYNVLGGMRESLIIDPERVLAIEPYLALDRNLDPVEVDPLAPSHYLQQNPPAGVEYAGIPDVLLAPSSYEVDCWDWKSFFAIVEPDTFQSEFYPLLVFQHFPAVEIVRFHLQFVRYGASRMVEYTRAGDLERLKELARKERRRQKAIHGATLLHDEAIAEGGRLSHDPLIDITAADLEPMPGPHCVYCPKLVPSTRAVAQDRGWDAMDVCPIAKVNPYTELEPMDRLRFAVWTMYAVRENARLLREFVKVGGPIEVRDSNGAKHLAGYEIEERKKYPLFEVAKLIEKWEEQTGDKIGSKLCVGSTELNPLLDTKKRAGLRDEVEAVAYIKTGSKWKIGKAGKDEEDADGVPY